LAPQNHFFTHFRIYSSIRVRKVPETFLIGRNPSRDISTDHVTKIWAVCGTFSLLTKQHNQHKPKKKFTKSIPETTPKVFGD
jgi:hypothetical protein